MPATWDTLKLLSDSTRVRLLALLLKEELAVAELQEITLFPLRNRPARSPHQPNP